MTQANAVTTWWRNRTLTMKLALAFGAVGVLTATIVTTSMLALTDLEAQTRAVSTVSVAEEQDLNALNSAIYDTRIYVYNAMMALTEADKADYTAKVAASGASAQEAFDTLTSKNPVATSVAADFRSLWSTYLVQAQDCIDSEGAERAAFVTTAKATAKKALTIVADLGADVRADALARAASASNAASSARIRLLVVVALSAAVGVGLVLLVSRSVTRPVRRALAVVGEVAGGDLTRRIDEQRGDELGEMFGSLNRMQDSLSDLIQGIAASAAQLNSTAEHLTTASRGLADTVDHTSAQAQSVSAAAEQITANITGAATGAEQMVASIDEIAHGANDAASEAAQAATKASFTTQAIRDLAASSDAIGSVVATITAIAEQTNLLALNATIEAARAGEAGKGFAVVASEVKDLAQATGKATHDIAERISEMQRAADQVTAASTEIADLIQRISAGQGSIAAAVDEQTAMSGEISRNVSEAATGVGAIAATIATVADAMEQSRERAKDTERTATSLQDVADHLQGAVGRFRVG